jgi:hypothetical protein
MLIIFFPLKRIVCHYNVRNIHVYNVVVLKLDQDKSIFSEPPIFYFGLLFKLFVSLRTLYVMFIFSIWIDCLLLISLLVVYVSKISAISWQATLKEMMMVSDL